jgi:hypothetical protein
VLCRAKLYTTCTHRDSSSKGSVARRAGKREIAREFWKRRKKKESEDTRNRHKTRHYYIALCMCLVYTSDLGEREFLYVCVSRPPHSNVYGMHQKKSLKVWHRRRVYTQIFSVIFGPLYSHLPRLSYAIARPTFTYGKSQRERRGKVPVHNALTAYRVDLYKHPKIVKNTLFKKIDAWDYHYILYATPTSSTR